MPINLSDLSQKQSLLTIIGIVVAVVILALVGSMYGGFLKTQVAAPVTTYSANGNLSALTLERGFYTLQFTGRDATGAVAHASTRFEILRSPTVPPY